MKTIYVNCRAKNYIESRSSQLQTQLMQVRKESVKKKKERKKEKTVSAAGVNTAVIVKPYLSRQSFCPQSHAWHSYNQGPQYKE